MGVNSLPKTVIRQRRGCDLNLGPSAPESSTLTTRVNCFSINVAELWNHTPLEWRRAPTFVQRFASKAHRTGPSKGLKSAPH